MKIIIYRFLIISLIGGAIMACSGDNLSHKDVPQEIRNDFQDRYPDAENIQWEKEGNFFESDFTQNGLEKKAIYDQEGNWVQTESEIAAFIPGS